MPRRNKQSFRPYRIQRPVYQPSADELKPFNSSLYIKGETIYCRDGTNRIITEITYRNRCWLIHYVLGNEKGKGVILESSLINLDLDKEQLWKGRHRHDKYLS